MRTSSFAIRISANVASTCERWSRAYSVRSTATSSSMPASAVAGIASSTPSANEPVACTRVAAKNAPSMYSDPCARLIMSMMPNTSVRPAASRNSISPNCRPFSDCSRIRIQDNQGRRRPSLATISSTRFDMSWSVLSTGSQSTIPVRRTIRRRRSACSCALRDRWVRVEFVAHLHGKELVGGLQVQGWKFETLPQGSLLEHQIERAGNIDATVGRPCADEPYILAALVQLVQLPQGVALPAFTVRLRRLRRSPLAERPLSSRRAWPGNPWRCR